MEGFKIFSDSIKNGFGSLDDLEKKLLDSKDQPYVKDLLLILRKSKNSFAKRDLEGANKLFKKTEDLVNRITNDRNGRA